MTESDLDTLLNRAAFRWKIERALRTALAVVCVSMLCGSICIFVARWQGYNYNPIAAYTMLPAFFAIFAGGLCFSLIQLSPVAVAALLDERAGIKAHLQTWIYGRNKFDLKAHCILRAQAESTLRSAELINLSIHMPLQLPVWSRVFWLAAIVYLSAIMTPPNDSRTAHAITLQPVSSDTMQTRKDVANKNSDTQRETSQKQLISPAELRKLELMATDEKMPKSIKAEALKELLNAIGDLPELELTPDVKQVLDLLRKDLALGDAAKLDGSVQTTSAHLFDKANQAEVHAAQYAPFDDTTKTWAVIETKFVDVRSELAKYYQSK